MAGPTEQLVVTVSLTDEQVADLKRRWDAVSAGCCHEPIALVPVREPGDHGTTQPAARIVPPPAREPGAAFADPPLCPVCKVNHVGWWITSKGQHFDPYCGACGFTPSDPYRASIDPVFRDQMLRRAITRSRG